MRLTVFVIAVTGVVWLSAQSTSDLPFQVLIAQDAQIFGQPVEPLQFVDDVTSIEVADGGFVCLVHKGGTTYEYTEKIFTFYLKPEVLKDRKERPAIELLHNDSSTNIPKNVITVVSPAFDRSGYLEWNENEPFNVYWEFSDKTFLNFILKVSTGSGSKIQDFRTQHTKYTLKPNTYGLSDGLFTFKVTSTFAGDTKESKTYTVQLKPAPAYPVKAADLILKALDLESIPKFALPIWQEAIAKENGKFYLPLFEKFLLRNKVKLKASGVDVQQLLSQNR